MHHDGERPRAIAIAPESRPQQGRLRQIELPLQKRGQAVGDQRLEREVDSRRDALPLLVAHDHDPCSKTLVPIDKSAKSVREERCVEGSTDRKHGGHQER